jgi:hypothetical protein
MEPPDENLIFGSDPAVPSSTISPTVQRTKTQNSKQKFPGKELRGHSPNFHIHMSVSDLYILMIDLSFLLQEISGLILEICKAHRHLNVEICTEATQFPEKEYINGIFFAMHTFGIYIPHIGQWIVAHRDNASVISRTAYIL